jgi:hypothetical protein
MTGKKIALRLIKFLFAGANSIKFLDYLYKQFYNNPESNDEVFSFENTKSKTKKFSVFKKKLEANNYNVEQLQFLIKSNIEHAPKEEQEFILETLEYELRLKFKKVFIRPVPTTTKLNKTMLKSVFPKGQKKLLDQVIANTNIVVADDYKEKIEALLEYLYDDNVGTNQLSNWIKEINKITESAEEPEKPKTVRKKRVVTEKKEKPVTERKKRVVKEKELGVVTEKKERKKRVVKEKQLEDLSKIVTEKFKELNENEKPAKQRKTQAKRTRRHFKGFDFDAIKISPEQQEDLIKEIDEILEKENHL